MGNILVPVVMFGWVPLVILLFAALSPRRAVIVAFLTAWLFLPMAGYKVSGFPDYTKMSATTLGVLAGMLLFDSGALLRFRLKPVDWPMLVWCVSPIASSVTNGLGIYDGISAAATQTITWGLPYLIGRIYFNSPAALRELAIALFVGGLVYAPLCLFEARMSPQLHRLVYGVHGTWGQNVRFGGWRPTVFMQHGLMVGMWMCMSALAGFWLLQSKALPRTLWHVPTWFWLATIFITAILCRSTGALLLLGVGVGVWFSVRQFGTAALLWVLVAAAPVYSTVRMLSAWDGSDAVVLVNDWLGPDRAESLEFRLKQEEALVQKALNQPVFGWGGWGRARVWDDYGQSRSVTDGLWVIVLGNNGLMGWGSLTLAMLLPIAVVLRKLPVKQWLRPEMAAIPASAVVVLLHWIDCIPNAMLNPIFTLLLGGLGSLAVLLSGEARPTPLAVLANPARRSDNSTRSTEPVVTSS